MNMLFKIENNNDIIASLEVASMAYLSSWLIFSRAYRDCLEPVVNRGSLDTFFQ